MYKDVYIYPTAIVEPGIVIGRGSTIGPYCYIRGNVVIGEECKLEAFVSIGALPQYKTQPRTEGGQIIIKSGTEIREFVTVNLPVGAKTEVGEGCLLMANVHIPHDSMLREYAVLAPGVTLGGYIKIGRHCQIGLNATMHQFSEIDDYCMLGAEAFFKGKSPKGIIWAGVPARPLKVNLVGIERYAGAGEGDEIIKAAMKYIEESL